MSTIKTKIKRLIKILTGQVAHLSKTVEVKKKWYGNAYGGFYLCPNFLNENSVVYSFGIGEDISFDLAVIENHKCHVYGFDPTPKSIEWIRNNQFLPKNFSFFEYGIADKSGIKEFYLPKNSEYISGSYIKQENVSDEQKIPVEMKSMSDIVAILGHKQIDIVKMDIEGAEYGIIDSLLACPVTINQILIEFHDRFFADKEKKSINVIIKLRDHGYEIFGVSDSFEEVSFIKKALLKNY